MPTPLSEQPTFSVVIPSFNRADVVVRAIESVLTQAFGDLELIVVDDGSTDATSEVVARRPDERLRYIAQANQGRSAARNAGARAARGRYVTFLDSDDEVRPAWLEQLGAALDDGFAEIALCGRDIVDPDGHVVSHWVPDPGVPDLEVLVNHFEAGQVALLRDLFLARGGYATEIQYGENTELAIRLLCTPNPAPHLAVVPDALRIVHRAKGDRGYGSARAESARFVIEHHPECRSVLPHLWASYHAIAGVDEARRRSWRTARRHFRAALRSEPTQLRHCGRLLAATVPAIGRHIWPDPGDGGGSVAADAPMPL